MDVAEFGAIFMANRKTMDECLSLKLFGLPSPMENFVGGVKAGMLLFLFEYEKRSLHGVFEAVSDGAIDIVPGAYASSGKRYPAQVRFERFWDCEPLRESDFREAIWENYFQKYKFRFGLSRDQVSRLLWMFCSNRKDVAPFRNLSRETERFALERKPTRKQPNSGPSDSTVNGKAYGSFYSKDSRASIGSFDCESSDFGKGSGSNSSEGLEKLQTPSKGVDTSGGDFVPLVYLDNIPDCEMKFVQKLENPSKTFSDGLEDFKPVDLDDWIESIARGCLEKLEDPSKDIGTDLGDFIPLPASPSDSDNEKSPRNGNDLREVIPLNHYVPVRLINCETHTGKEEETQDPSEDNGEPRSDVSDDKDESLRIKGLYSDDQANQSVFSRLKFNSGSANKDKPVQESEGDLKKPWMYGKNKKSVFSRLSMPSKVIQNINDALSDQPKTTVKETELTMPHREDGSEMMSTGRYKEDQLKGKETIRDVMDMLLQRHRSWWKTDPRYEKEDPKPEVKKNVFSRLSWVSGPVHQDNIATVTLRRGYPQGRAREARYSDREQSGNYGRNGLKERSNMKRTRDGSEETLRSRPDERRYGKRTRDDSEETFEKSTYFGKKPKRQAEAEKRDLAKSSESEYMSEEQAQKKLTGPVIEQALEVLASGPNSCLHDRIPSEESTNCKESTGSSEFPTKEIIADENMLSLEKEVKPIVALECNT